MSDVKQPTNNNNNNPAVMESPTVATRFCVFLLSLCFLQFTVGGWLAGWFLGPSLSQSVRQAGRQVVGKGR